jgi:hypothetical protein
VRADRDLDQEEPPPGEMAVGEVIYNDFRKGEGR